MTNVVRCFALLVGLAAHKGCASEREVNAPRSERGMVMRADSGLELRVFLPRDTINVRDSLPVEVQYVLVNGPKATRISNAPERYVHRVEREDGRAVRPKRGGAPPTMAWGRRVLLVLPANAWLGQSGDMRCLSLWGGYDESVERDCLAEYDFREPGKYRVIVEHMTMEVWPNLDSLKAISDASKVPLAVEPLIRGSFLADTATLVVLPE